jgi:hypothetical protein
LVLESGGAVKVVWNDAHTSNLLEFIRGKCAGNEGTLLVLIRQPRSIIIILS